MSNIIIQMTYRLFFLFFCPFFFSSHLFCLIIDRSERLHLFDWSDRASLVVFLSHSDYFQHHYLWTLAFFCQSSASRTPFNSYQITHISHYSLLLFVFKRISCSKIKTKKNDRIGAQLGGVQKSKPIVERRLKHENK